MSYLTMALATIILATYSFLYGSFGVQIQHLDDGIDYAANIIDLKHSLQHMLAHTTTPFNYVQAVQSNFERLQTGIVLLMTQTELNSDHACLGFIDVVSPRLENTIAGMDAMAGQGAQLLAQGDCLIEKCIPLTALYIIAWPSMRHRLSDKSQACAAKMKALPGELEVFGDGVATMSARSMVFGTVALHMLGACPHAFPTLLLWSEMPTEASQIDDDGGKAVQHQPQQITTTTEANALLEAMAHKGVDDGRSDRSEV